VRAVEEFERAPLWQQLLVVALVVVGSVFVVFAAMTLFILLGAWMQWLTERLT
jgi:protein-S-isoprenylcysteine O-methyltransferase Ste14